MGPHIILACSAMVATPRWRPSPRGSYRYGSSATIASQAVFDRLALLLQFSLLQGGLMRTRHKAEPKRAEKKAAPQRSRESASAAQSRHLASRPCDNRKPSQESRVAPKPSTPESQAPAGKPATAAERVVRPRERLRGELIERTAELVATKARNKQLLERERDARLRADHAIRSKADFFAAVSHDLRTPLQAIFGYIELLEREIHGPLSREQAHHVEQIRRNQQLLVGLLNEILDFTRPEGSERQPA